MSDLHELCSFKKPITSDYITQLRHYLSNGIPSTYTTEEAYNYIHNIDEEPKSTTTPLHLICSNYPEDCSEEQMEVIKQMVEILFEYGAGWCLVDANGDTPGCILVKRGLRGEAYDEIVNAGVRAELLLRKVNDNIEFLEEDGDLEQIEEGDEAEEVPDLVESQSDLGSKSEGSKSEGSKSGVAPNSGVESSTDSKSTVQSYPEEIKSDYLSNKLTYKDDALLTSQNDGVMMSWESFIMQKGCDALFSISEPQMTVLNIGFGMGIIDTMIQKNSPYKHYIIEPHPDVLAKMRADGWYEKDNVVILEGEWQQHLSHLLDSGIFFNGIYYDTFSEHYSDMLELYDYIVGLLKINGTFSFFNGLGADRQVVYEVYKKLVEIDLGQYGLDVEFDDVKVGDLDWEGVKRSYWNCPVYYHPLIRFRQ